MAGFSALGGETALKTENSAFEVCLSEKRELERELSLPLYVLKLLLLGANRLNVFQSIFRSTLGCALLPLRLLCEFSDF